MSAASPRLLLHLAIGLYSGVHLLVAALIPLVAHEAHYSGYALDLQLSFPDHPPLSAWLQAPVLALWKSDFSARLLPIALSALTQYLLAGLAGLLYPGGSRWLGLVCVLILQGAAVFHLSMTLTPDVVLIPLALLSAVLSWRALADDRWRDWGLLGLTFGLAGLAKYTAVTLPVSLVVLGVLARGPRLLVSARLWLAGLVCVAVISPVLIWNAENDWLTVRFHSDYQFEDVVGWTVSGLLVSALNQLLYYSPLLVIGGLIVLAGGLRDGVLAFARARPLGIERARNLLPLLFALPVLLTFLLAVLESRGSPHWSVLGWLFLIPPVARWLIEGWRSTDRGAGVRSLTWASGAYSVLVTLFLVVVLSGVGRWPDYLHPMRLAVGWEQGTRRAVELLDGLDRSGRETAPVLLVRNWHHVPLLTWYAPGVPVKNLFADLNPYNIKYGRSDDTTWGILVYPRGDDEPRIRDLTRDFNCTPVDALPIYYGASKVQTFHYYECYPRHPAP